MAQAIERGPTPYLDGVVRWRLCDLAQWLWEEFRVSVSVQTLGREVRALGYRKLSPRPRHYAQDADAAETLKKLPRRSGANRRGSRQRQSDRNLVPGRSQDRAEEQDHTPLGQARIESPAPHDQRTRSAYIFDATCPGHGKAAALIMPWCDTYAMNQHLGISKNLPFRLFCDSLSQ